MKVLVEGNKIRIYGEHKDHVIINVNSNEGTDCFSFSVSKGIMEHGCVLPSIEINNRRIVKTGHNLLEEIK